MSVFKQWRAMTRLGWFISLSILLISIWLWCGYLLLIHPPSIDACLAFAVIMGCHVLVVYQARSKWKFEKYCFKFESSHLPLILWDFLWFIPFTGLMWFFVDQKDQMSVGGVIFLIVWFLVALCFRWWVRRSYILNYQVVLVSQHQISHSLFEVQFNFDRAQIINIHMFDDSRIEIELSDVKTMRIHTIKLGRWDNSSQLRDALGKWHARNVSKLLEGDF